ncbi:MAG: hypothetical protein IKF51_05680 [Solobacterium sp.]|nr:hypothetical protein [Solobacterium sp.]
MDSKAYIRYKDDKAALESLVRVIGDSYRNCCIQTEIYEGMNLVDRYRNDYEDKKQFILKIQKGLPFCSRDTRIIIEHEVLTISESKWYTKYFTTSSYYRHKYKAYIEFLRCLDI